MSLFQLVQQENYPSFSLVMTGADGSSLVLRDGQPARRRVIQLGDRAGSVIACPAGDDPLMRTVDMRHQGEIKLDYRTTYGSEPSTDNVDTFADDEDFKKDPDQEGLDAGQPQRNRAGPFVEVFWSAVRCLRRVFDC